MRIVIMGSGGLGGLFGGLLAKAGAEVMFIARGCHLQAMQTSGLKILSQTGDVDLPSVHAVDDPAGQSAADFVIFTVKGADTRAACELIAPIVGSKTGIICFQNGIEGIDILADHYGTGAVIPGATFAPAMIEKPGVIRHVGAGSQTTVGEWNGEMSNRLEAFATLAKKAGLDITVNDDIHTVVWAKFVAFATFSALTSLTRLPLRTIGTTPETLQLAFDAMAEVIALADARGIKVPAQVFDDTKEFVQNVDPAWKTSMANDLAAGKAIESDSISGSVHRLGQELRVPTPINTVFYRALKPFAA
jgi:2-dehydropantoate 2-reductase